ncbi:hypothetical protein [Aphanizomenon sp. UHCC 0183]
MNPTYERSARDSEDHYLIWNCAQNILYPEFYQTWHHS